MTWGEEGMPIEDEWTNVLVCSLDQPEQVIPAGHTCVESQLPWYQLADELPRTRSEDDPDIVAAWSAAELSHDGTPLS